MLIIRSLIFFLFFFQCLQANYFDPDRGNHFLLTTPHSGTNLTYCYLQALIGKPVYRLNLDQSLFEKNPLNSSLDFSKKPLFRSHDGRFLAKFNQNKSKLLFLLRDYKENLYRNTFPGLLSNEEFKDLFLNNHSKFILYITNLTTYDQWDPNYRLLIYYEDLITNPEKEVRKIIEFFDESVSDFLNPELLKKVTFDVLSYYNKRYEPSGGSHSGGKALKYHSRKVLISVLQEIDNYIAIQYPDFWLKYLNRYQE